MPELIDPNGGIENAARLAMSAMQHSMLNQIELHQEVMASAPEISREVDLLTRHNASL